MIKLLASSVILGTSLAFKWFEEYNTLTETVFVYEMLRHGARADEAHIKSPVYEIHGFWQGIKPGDLTSLGRIQHLRNGLARRKEYVL